MPKRVLDTNILIAHWREFRPYANKRPVDAESWASRLIEDKQTDAIVSPVEIEFLCGIVNQHEMELAEAYLQSFRIVDERKTPPQDWGEARRVAKYVGFQARPRDLGDCLITEIADRLNYEIVTDDRVLQRQRGRTRQRRR